MGRIPGGGKYHYSLYKGDVLLGTGTAEQLANQFGVSPRTIRWYASPAARRRDTGTRRVAERL